MQYILKVESSKHYLNTMYYDLNDAKREATALSVFYNEDVSVYKLTELQSIFRAKIL